jgi:hypothetical protein
MTKQSPLTKALQITRDYFGISMLRISTLAMTSIQQIRHDPICRGDESIHVRPFVIVRGVDAGTDQRQRHIAARTPERFAVRTIERIHIGLVWNTMLFGESEQLLIQATMIHAAAVLDAQRDIELIRLLTFADDRHIHADYLRHVGWDARRRAVTDLLIIGDVEVHGSGGTEACLR